jgi:hypothetical protein
MTKEMDKFVDSLLINYPQSGRITLPIGTTNIDIKTKQVFLADGTTDEMYSVTPIEFARSLLLYADCSIDLKLYISGSVVHTSTRFPTWSRFDVKFDQMEITTSKQTSFYMQISNMFDGVPQIVQATYCEGNPFVSNTTVAVAGTPNNEEVYAGLGRNGRKGTLRHNGASGILSVETSHDGTTFADAIPLGPGDVLKFDGDDIHTIRIDADTNGTPYVLIMQPEV